MMAAVLLIAGAGLLGGCASVLIGAGATTGVAAAQERGVKGAFSDKWISAQIASGHFKASETLFRKVGIEVVEGEVLLTGTVPTRDDALTAVRIAWSVDGVERVINEIEVAEEPGFGQTATDIWIAARLRTKLTLDGEILAINYTIETDNGVVYLMGIAQDEAELNRVIAHARDLSHVRDVVSHVRLKAVKAAE